MQIGDIRLLYEYNYWANDRILRAADGIGQEELSAPVAFPSGSLRGTLVHTLSAEWIWRMRWQGDPPRAMLAEADFPTLAAIQARWKEEQAAMWAFIAGLSDADLARPLVLPNTRGEMQPPRVLGHLMAHVVNHGTQHRSEVAAILTLLGRSPGDLDLALLLSERAQR
jgi:uncharacterized damage-inducible protein DinB